MKASHLITSLVLGLTLSAGPLGAEDPRPAPAVRVENQTAVFTVQYADMTALQDQIVMLPNYFGGGTLRFDGKARTIFVIGSRELVAACTEAIKKLDVPPKPVRSLEFTFYILVASQKPGGECPPAIAGFCEQMKGLYKGFRLLDTVTLRGRDGDWQRVEGIIPAAEAGGDSMPYRLAFNPVCLAAEGKDAKALIRLGKLEFKATVTTRLAGKDGSQVSTRDVGVTANVEFAEGQEVGITTVSQGRAGESLCLVAKAKVLE